MFIGIRSALITLLCCALGCSAHPEPERVDANEAVEILAIALDAWKEGEAQALDERQPSIRFVDDDLTEGASLTEYEIELPEARIGAHENVRVALSLRDRQGNGFAKSVTYQISLAPTLTVLRSDP